MIFGDVCIDFSNSKEKISLLTVEGKECHYL